MECTHVVFVEQGGGRYLFEAPAWPPLESGDKVLCDTVRGKDCPGVCVSNSLYLTGRELEAVAAGMRARFPLNRVVGKVSVERFKYEEADDGNALQTESRHGV